MLKDDEEESSEAAPSDLMSTSKPGHHDLLFGRGGETNNHSGNVLFRQLVEQYRAEYQDAPKGDKPEVARMLVAHWRRLDPPGRFLSKKEGVNLWVDVGDQAARRRASKSLGERNRPVTTARAVATDVDSQPSRTTSAAVTKAAPSTTNQSPSLLDAAGNKRHHNDINSTLQSPFPQVARTASYLLSSGSMTDMESYSANNPSISHEKTPNTAFFNSLSQLFDDQKSAPSASSFSTQGYATESNTGSSTRTASPGGGGGGVEQYANVNAAASAAIHRNNENSRNVSNHNAFAPQITTQHHHDQQIPVRDITTDNTSHQSPQHHQQRGSLADFFSVPGTSTGTSFSSRANSQDYNDLQKTAIPQSRGNIMEGTGMPTAAELAHGAFSSESDSSQERSKSEGRKKEK